MAYLLHYFKRREKMKTQKFYVFADNYGQEEEEK